MMAELRITTNLWQSLRRQLERKIGDRSQAEDCLQSAYVKMCERKSDTAIKNEAAFLQTAAYNLAIDDRRSARVRLAAPNCISDIVELSDRHPLADEVLIVQERLDRVRSGLMRLSPRTREIFLMHRLDGLKHREIAATLGISISAVEKQVARATLAISELN